MNKTEYLLTCLGEECAEVQQAVAKALRFGLDVGFPGGKTTNAQDIAKECVDVIAVIEMLESDKIINNIRTQKAIDKKKDKVFHYMEHSKKLGTLIDFYPTENTIN